MSKTNPAHYRKSKTQPIDIIWELGLGEAFCMGNVIKYLIRAPHKNDFDGDLDKAIWYIENLRDHHAK